MRDYTQYTIKCYEVVSLIKALSLWPCCSIAGNYIHLNFTEIMANENPNIFLTVHFLVLDSITVHVATSEWEKSKHTILSCTVHPLR